MSVRNVSSAGLNRIGIFEGLRLRVYNDKYGHATIGYGHLLHRGPYTTKDRQTITESEARDLLRKDAYVYADAVNAAVHEPLTQNQFDALVCLAFNIGVGDKTKGTGMAGSSLVKAINLGKADDHDLMRRLFCLWCKGGTPKKTDPYLLDRRNAEATMFNAPDAP